MWIVEVSYGMEHCQTERKEFNTKEEAETFFNEKVANKPFYIELYEKKIIAKYSALD